MQQVDPAFYPDHPYEPTYTLPVAEPKEHPMSNTALTLDNLQEPEMRDLLTQIADAVVQRSGLKETVQRLEERVADLERQVEMERNTVHDLQACLDQGPDYERKIEELESGLAAEQHTVETLKRELEEARETNRALVAEVSEWQGKFHRAEDDLGNLEGEREAIQVELNNLKAEHERVCAERHALEQETIRLRAIEEDAFHYRESRDHWKANAEEGWGKYHEAKAHNDQWDSVRSEALGFIQQAIARLAA